MVYQAEKKKSLQSSELYSKDSVLCDFGPQKTNTVLAHNNTVLVINKCFKNKQTALFVA